MKKQFDIRDVIQQEVPEHPYFWVDVQISLNQILENFASELFYHPEVSAVVVKDDEKIIGSISRKILLELADSGTTRNMIELGGDPQKHALYLVCPQEGCLYRELIVFFDPIKPPKCSYHKLVLKRENP